MRAARNGPSSLLQNSGTKWVIKLAATGLT